MSSASKGVAPARLWAWSAAQALTRRARRGLHTSRVQPEPPPGLAHSGEFGTPGVERAEVALDGGLERARRVATGAPRESK